MIFTAPGVESTCIEASPRLRCHGPCVTRTDWVRAWGTTSHRSTMRPLRVMNTLSSHATASWRHWIHARLRERSGAGCHGMSLRSTPGSTRPTIASATGHGATGSSTFSL